MQDLIEYIALSLVDDPLQVRVSQYLRGTNVEIRLQVAKEDMGKIIGKQGRNAQAIRTILSAASGKARKRYVLEIVE